MSSLIFGGNSKKHIDIAIKNKDKRLNKKELTSINYIYKVFSKNTIFKPKIPIKQ